ncbi:hypothetical protein SAVIM338S_06916 [Streptomyces avidinii]
MTEALGALPPRRRTGDEPVHLDGAAHGSLLGF